MKNAFLILLLGSVVSALAGPAAAQVTSGSPDGKKLVFASNRNGKQRGETNLFLAEWRP